MDELKVGQVWQFFEQVDIDGKVIEKGAQVRVGLIEQEVMDTKVMVTLLHTEPTLTVTMPRRILTLNALPVPAK